MMRRRGWTAASFFRLAARQIPVLASLIRYAKRSPYAHLLGADGVTSAASMAYVRALRLYDPSKGGLLTYAKYYVRRFMIADFALSRSLRTYMASRLGRHIRYIDYDDRMAEWISPIEYDDDDHATHDQSPSPEARLAALESVARLMSGADLTRRERIVIRRRWLSPRQETFRRLARRFDLTPERVRQIEAAALLKLRRYATGGTSRQRA